MSATGSRQVPEEEMFFAAPPRPAESPVVEPLRISKQDHRTPSPESRLNGITPPYPDDNPNPQEGTMNSTTSFMSIDSAQLRPSDYPPALRPRDGRESRPATLAERRGNAPKPLPESPGPDVPDKEGLFKKYQRIPPPAPSNGASSNRNSYAQQYFPPPQPSPARRPSSAARGPSSAQSLQPPNSSINRISSTASTSTTRAQRGSPPPPETPVVGPEQQPGSDIEARYAAAGIAGTSTLAGLQSQNSAAQRRAEQYAHQPATNGQHPLRRPWTPTEQPGSQPHGPPTVYQGDSVVSADNPPASPFPAPSATPSSQPAQPQQQDQPSRIQPNPLEQDLERMRITSSPPPAYSSVSGPAVSQGYPAEKQRPATTSPANGPPGHPAVTGLMNGAGVGSSVASPMTTAQNHPAFANDPRQDQNFGQSPQNGLHNGTQAIFQPVNASPAPSGIPPASPPPLPEGWIAHLDSNSGQYYYIHLPTQSTQWEFPKGPTPLNLNDTPMSPVGSIYSSHPLASPALSAFGKPIASPGMPLTPGFESLQSPVMAGFTGPPPVSGVDLYKVAPTNGVYFGPYLRYTNMDVENGTWLGSILLVTDAAQPPTIHIHQSLDLSPNPRQLKAVNIAAHQRWTFYRYDVDLRMEETGPAKWTYAITSHLGCTRYEFLVAGRYETNWRFITTSGNDFSLGVNANERTRLGGVGVMWKDIMQKHTEIGGFHAQMCLGGQIYADRMWKEIPSLKQWLVISGKEQRKNMPWTAAHEEDVSHAYFHYYTSHFDQPYVRESFAQIPYICQLDDHDIFDGFGSYPDHMQFSNMFKNIGRLGIEMYLLFQHHTTLDILRSSAKSNMDLFTVTGTGWHFIKYLGPAVVVVGPDCRSERNPHQVMAGQTYQGIFPKVAMLPPSVQHCLWMISVPMIYPRLETAEHIAKTVTTGKKTVTGAYNVLGKVTSSVAGVVGAKDMVGSGFDSIKRAVGKSGLMGGILSPFGELDVLDELRDQWTHESKDLERTYLIRTLQTIAQSKSIRMTFLSGAVNVCGAGLVHDPTRPSDHKTMYQLISSSVVNGPPPSYILKLLHSSNRPLYIPANGHRSSTSPTAPPTDTKEDMMEIFQTDVTGQPREYRKLMGRRNYAAVVAYDPETVNSAYGQAGLGINGTASNGAAAGGGKLNLAVDFMVQGDGLYPSVAKYGPVIVPSLGTGK